MAIAHVAYHYESESWWIDSPEYPGYTAVAPSKREATELARVGLPFFAGDPDLVVVGLIDPAQSVSVAQTADGPTFNTTGVPQGMSLLKGWSKAPPTGSLEVLTG